MNKTVKIYVMVLVLLFVGLFAIEFSKEQPINWNKTYNETHKIPFGTFVLYEEMENLFPSSEIKDVRVTAFEYFDEFYSWMDSSYSVGGSFIHIDEYADLDDVSAQELLDFASHGNTVFVATSYPPQKFYDSLDIDLENSYDFKGEAEFSFSNPWLKNDSITINRGLSNIHFSDFDTLNTTVLGYQKFDSIPYVNFIKVAHGLGEVYLHLQPIAFTNYNLLKKDNQKYVASALSYLPDETVFFDSRNKYGRDLGSSPLRFILSQPALKTALYLGFFSLIVFMIFNAKRRQRIVNVIRPVENTTIAFTKTIGNLYYETKDHNNLIDKKITYFLEYIRRVYFLDTQILDEKFVKSLIIKSGKDADITRKLINMVVDLKAKRNCTETDLLRLNTLIEDFYNS